MNERIRELVKQATLATYYNAVTGVTSETFDKEKFAELIVRDCAKISDIAEPYRSSDLILQYFGVTE